MILLKHNAIENFSSFTKSEKEDLIIQELSKAFMLYPRATADILETCQIKYNSLKPNDLALAVEQGRENLKMLNRVVRLAFLVNRKGNNSMKGHNRNISFRKVMSEGRAFLDNNKDAMKEATLIARDMMKNKIFSKHLTKSVTAYAALDGGEVLPSYSEQKKIAEAPPENIKSNKWVWVAGSALILVAVFYYIKKRKNES